MGKWRVNVGTEWLMVVHGGVMWVHGGLCGYMVGNCIRCRVRWILGGFWGYIVTWVDKGSLVHFL